MTDLSVETENADLRRDAPASDRTPTILAAVIVILLITHLSQDIVYGFESGTTIHFIAVLIASLWLCAVLVSGPRIGYALVLLVSSMTPVIPLIHMSGTGVAADLHGADFGLVFFVWTMLVLGALAPVAILLSLQGLWRLRKGVLSFFVLAALPLALGCGVLTFVLVG